MKIPTIKSSSTTANKVVSASGQSAAAVTTCTSTVGVITASRGGSACKMRLIQHTLNTQTSFPRRGKTKDVTCGSSTCNYLQFCHRLPHAPRRPQGRREPSRPSPWAQGKQ